MKDRIHLNKQLYSLLFILCFGYANLAMALVPEASTKLIDHLVEVNKEWLKQDLDIDILNRSIRFENDEDRIQMHLQLVIQVLLSRSTEHLNAKQLANRTALLEELQCYQEGALFPKNYYHHDRQPYFIDDHNTACAVGHLALVSGATKLVGQIKAENNFAYIAELDPKYPALGQWAVANGFTMDELAWIQPAYPPEPLPFVTMGDGGGVNGIVHTMYVEDESNLLYIAGDFDTIDGVTANSIIAWDGENWISIGNGVDGTIHALKYYRDKLFIGGDFVLPGVEGAQNLAFWDGESLQAMQIGDMEGVVMDMEVLSNKLYIGGSFKKVNGEDKSHLVFYDNNEELKLYNGSFFYSGGEWVEEPGATEVNAPVYDLQLVGNFLLVGGDFTLTAPNYQGTTVDDIDANYLAYWDGFNWVGALYGAHNPVRALNYINGNLFVGCDIEMGTVGFSILQSGLWLDDYSYSFASYGSTGNTIREIFPYNNGAFVIGAFNLLSINSLGNHVAYFDEDLNAFGYALFDNQVRAVTIYQDKLIFAGDFEQIGTEVFNNFAVLENVTSTSGVEERTKQVKVFNYANALNIQYENLDKAADLSLFTMQGQEVKSFRLAKGAAQLTEDLSTLPAGAYVYRISNSDFMQSGKLIKN